MQQRASLFEWLFIKPRRRWLALGPALAFALIPFLGAALAEDPGHMMQLERWRGLLVSPAMIVYIVAVAPSVEYGYPGVCGGGCVGPPARGLHRRGRTHLARCLPAAFDRGPVRFAGLGDLSHRRPHAGNGRDPAPAAVR